MSAAANRHRAKARNGTGADRGGEGGRQPRQPRRRPRPRRARRPRAGRAPLPPDPAPAQGPPRTARRSRTPSAPRARRRRAGAPISATACPGPATIKQTSTRPSSARSPSSCGRSPRTGAARFPSGRSPPGRDAAGAPSRRRSAGRRIAATSPSRSGRRTHTSSASPARRSGNGSPEPECPNLKNRKTERDLKALPRWQPVAGCLRSAGDEHPAETPSRSRHPCRCRTSPGPHRRGNRPARRASMRRSQRGAVSCGSRARPPADASRPRPAGFRACPGWIGSVEGPRRLPSRVVRRLPDGEGGSADPDRRAVAAASRICNSITWSIM